MAMVAWSGGTDWRPLASLGNGGAGVEEDFPSEQASVFGVWVVVIGSVIVRIRGQCALKHRLVEDSYSDRGGASLELSYHLSTAICCVTFAFCCFDDVNHPSDLLPDDGPRADADVSRGRLVHLCVCWPCPDGHQACRHLVSCPDRGGL
jgi:hypothetical protein